MAGRLNGGVAATHTHVPGRRQYAVITIPAVVRNGRSSSNGNNDIQNGFARTAYLSDGDWTRRVRGD